MRIRTGVDSDKDLNLDISEMDVDNVLRARRTLSLTFREEEVVQLRDQLDSYLDGRRLEFKKFWESSRKPARPLPQRVSLVTMIDRFESLSDSGEPFYCVFTKQDGTERKMWAKVTFGRVQFSYKTRQSYVDVVDLDLERESDHNCDRKIVIQRVKSLVVGQSEYIAR